jgi:hypothetical protein
MTVKTVLILIFLFLYNNLDAIDKFQQKIYDAEYFILLNKYDQAILKYNEAQRIRPLDLSSCYNYFHIIISDSSLKKLYLDTLISFVVQLQHEHIGYFKKNVYPYIDSNEVKIRLDDKSASKFYTEISNRKAKFKERIKLIQDKDQEIRKKAISFVGRDSMYLKEPYRTEIQIVDSIHYIQFCHILKEINCDIYITNVILEFPALMNHLLIFPDSTMTDKLSLLISECIDKAVHGKEKLAVSLQNNYNTSRYHKPNSNYNIMIDFEMTFNYLFYKFPSREVLNELNIKRNELGLESVERYLSKLIWTMKHNCDSKIDLVHDKRIFTFKNDDQEKEFNLHNMNHGYKSISIKCTSY